MATVVCEKHGLRFDPERANGCVLCRREAAGATAPAGTGAAPRRDAVAPPAIAPAVGLTFAIWILAGMILYAAHAQVVASLGGWSGEAAAADPYGYDAPVDDGPLEDLPYVGPGAGSEEGDGDG